METKEWVRVSRAANMACSVTVTLVRGNLTAKWSVKTFSNAIRDGVKQARSGAHAALADLEAALAELDTPEES